MKTVAVGVTGGIGSGKTEVCRIFESAGAVVYYADPLAREIMNNDPAVRSRLQRAFGSDLYLPDGTLDRKSMAKILFADADAQETVHSIVHPQVIGHLRRIIAEERRRERTGIVAVEAALIYEAKITDLFDYTVVVDAEERVRIRRVTGRDGSAPADVRDRMQAQMNPRRKAAMADFVIHNSGSLEDLRERSLFVFQILSSIACSR